MEIGISPSGPVVSVSTGRFRTGLLGIYRQYPDSTQTSRDPATAKWIPANNNPRRQFMAARVHGSPNENQSRMEFVAEGEDLIALPGDGAPGGPGMGAIIHQLR